MNLIDVSPTPEVGEGGIEWETGGMTFTLLTN